jgi:hypothetical protein
MDARPRHLFDDATHVSAGDSRWRGKTSDDYWAFIGPFGGVTAATMLRALVDHPERSGDPLSMTVNFCAPIAQGAFDLDVRLVKANRSTQHWCVGWSGGRRACDRHIRRAPRLLVAPGGHVSASRTV